MSDLLPVPANDAGGAGTSIERPEGEQSTVLERLNALAMALVKTRDEAIKARSASGIEDIWREDEEFYEGIDDVNRGAKSNINWQSKPPGQGQPQVPEATSIVFVNITGPYVDAAAAKVGDILLPTDERAWSLSEVPVPELIDKATGILPQEVLEGMASLGATNAEAEGVQQAEAAQAQKVLAEARATAKKAETRIEDWHVEGQMHGEMRKLIDSATRLGSGVMKGPVPQNKRTVAYKDGALIVQDEIKPVSRCLDLWNFFPDGACGETIHRGAYTWERDLITPKVLEEMKKNPDYVGSQIDLCLGEGPKKPVVGTVVRRTADGKELDDKSLYEIWYFHGQAHREDLEAAGCTCPEGAKPVSIPAIFTLVNDRVIKGALNPLDTGEFPYDVMPWKRRANMPWGTGIARQIRVAQQIVTASVRTLLTNAGRAAGPVFLLKNGVVSPADGVMSITPWKIFYVGEDDTTDDVAKAMSMLSIPMMEKELMEIIQFGLKLAEDVTGLPMLLQGQKGDAPETYGGQQLVERNASGTLRRIARTFDDCITEPHVRRYYAWLLQYGDDDEKGTFIIDARGSLALVEREIYRTEVQQLLQASLNPAFGLDPKKTMAEHLRTTKKVPESFQYSEADLQRMAQQDQKPPDPRVQVAQLHEQGETSRKAAELQAEAQEKEKDRQLTLVEQEVLERIAAMKLSGAKEISFDELKAMLASTVMKLRTEATLATEVPSGAGTEAHIPAPGHVRPVMKPPVQVPGRAPPGRAFQQR